MAAVTVGTTATALPGASNALVQNRSAVSVFLGDAAVTVANGFELGTEMAVEITNGNGLHGIVASGTADLRILPAARGVYATPIP
jgi:hypothetical protein